MTQSEHHRITTPWGREIASSLPPSRRRNSINKHVPTRPKTLVKVHLEIRRKHVAPPLAQVRHRRRHPVQGNARDLEHVAGIRQAERLEARLYIVGDEHVVRYLG